MEIPRRLKPHRIKKRPAFFRGHLNLVFDAARTRRWPLESEFSAWVPRVRFHGMMMRDEGRMRPVVLKRMTSPSLVQSTMDCKSMATSSRKRSSTNHVAASTFRWRSTTSLLSEQPGSDRCTRLRCRGRRMEPHRRELLSRRHRTAARSVLRLFSTSRR